MVVEEPHLADSVRKAREMGPEWAKKLDASSYVVAWDGYVTVGTGGYTAWPALPAGELLRVFRELGDYSGRGSSYATAACGRSINSRGPIQAAGRNV